MALANSGLNKIEMTGTVNSKRVPDEVNEDRTLRRKSSFRRNGGNEAKVDRIGDG